MKRCMVVLAVVFAGCADVTSTNDFTDLLYTDVSVGGSQLCAIRAQHAFCGYGGGTPAPVLDSVQIREVAVGEYFACFIDFAARARCGSPDAVLLGRGVDAPVGDTVPIAIEAPVVQVAAGEQHACLRTDAGQVYCWGWNFAGALGYGSDGVPEGCIDGGCAIPVEVLPEFAFRDVAAGGEHTCAVSESSEVWCWGANSSGQSAPSNLERVSAPTRVPLEGRFVAVAAGVQHSCALDSSGAVWCWGNDSAGQLGDGPELHGAGPVRVSLPGPAVSLDAGGRVTCALDTRGTPHCWGYPSYFVPTLPAHTRPAAVEGIRFQRLSVGSSLACGVARVVGAACWAPPAGIPDQLQGQL